MKRRSLSLPTFHYYLSAFYTASIPRGCATPNSSIATHRSTSYPTYIYIFRARPVQTKSANTRWLPRHWNVQRSLSVLKHKKNLPREPSEEMNLGRCAESCSPSADVHACFAMNQALPKLTTLYRFKHGPKAQLPSLRQATLAPSHTTRYICICSAAIPTMTPLFAWWTTKTASWQPVPRRCRCSSTARLSKALQGCSASGNARKACPAVPYHAPLGLAASGEKGSPNIYCHSCRTAATALQCYRQRQLTRRIGGPVRITAQVASCSTSCSSTGIRHACCRRTHTSVQHTRAALLRAVRHPMRTLAGHDGGQLCIATGGSIISRKVRWQL